MTTICHSETLCSNCLNEGIEPFKVPVEGEYFACKKCSVTYGKDRKGNTFLLDETVLINNYHKKTDKRFFIVKGVYIFEECESGRMVFLVDKETGRPLKSILDVNWLVKTKVEL